VRYFGFFDTAINDWLVREGGLDIHAGDVIGPSISGAGGRSPRRR
jgi:hypothetical protein